MGLLINNELIWISVPRCASVSIESALLNSNLNDIKEALNQGINVSAVFKYELPGTFLGVPVIDGDFSDIEMIKNQGIILGLKAKGKAKKDLTGFAITDLEKYNF